MQSIYFVTETKYLYFCYFTLLPPRSWWSADSKEGQMFFITGKLSEDNEESSVCCILQMNQLILIWIQWNCFPSTISCCCLKLALIVPLHPQIVCVPPSEPRQHRSVLLPRNNFSVWPGQQPVAPWYLREEQEDINDNQQRQTETLSVNPWVRNSPVSQATLINKTHTHRDTDTDTSWSEQFLPLPQYRQVQFLSFAAEGAPRQVYPPSACLIKGKHGRSSVTCDFLMQYKIRGGLEYWPWTSSATSYVCVNKTDIINASVSLLFWATGCTLQCGMCHSNKMQSVHSLHTRDFLNVGQAGSP